MNPNENVQMETNDDPAASFRPKCHHLKLTGYKLHLNSRGRGNGIAVYFKEDKFVFKQDVSDEHIQLTVLEYKPILNKKVPFVNLK